MFFGPCTPVRFGIFIWNGLQCSSKAKYYHLFIFFMPKLQVIWYFLMWKLWLWLRKNVLILHVEYSNMRSIEMELFLFICKRFSIYGEARLLAVCRIIKNLNDHLPQCQRTKITFLVCRLPSVRALFNIKASTIIINRCREEDMVGVSTVVIDCVRIRNS